MSDQDDLSREEIEKHKRMVGLDEVISDLHKRSINEVEEELDPIFVKIFALAEKMFRNRD